MNDTLVIGNKSNNRIGIVLLEGKYVVGKVRGFRKLGHRSDHPKMTFRLVNCNDPENHWFDNAGDAVKKFLELIK